MTNELFKDIVKWQKATFPGSDAHAKLIHLVQEIREVHEAVILDAEPTKQLEEFADCTILLFGALAAQGFTLQDLTKAIEQKHEINKSRKWGQPDKDGVVNHVD